MIEKIAHKLTRKPKLVAAIAVLMLIPSIIGFAATRINYDILSYLPQDLPSSQGEQMLEDPFQMAATSMLVVDGMPAGYTNDLLNAIRDVPGVSNAIWISNLVGIQIPTDMIPASFRDMFFSGDATMMIIQYDHPGASDETMQAIEDVRSICNEKCFLAGFSVVIKDTRDVMDSELPLFVGLAILLALAAMLLTEEAGASTYFPGGVVSYSPDVKENVLGVRPETVESHGVVSLECAAEMAEGVRMKTHSDYALSITGVAGPDRSEGKDVGTVCFGFAGKDRGTETVMLHFSSWGRASVRRKSATAAFILMRAFIEGNGPLIDITTKWNYI